jgi:hypothetical protein
MIKKPQRRRPRPIWAAEPLDGWMDGRTMKQMTFFIDVGLTVVKPYKLVGK